MSLKVLKEFGHHQIMVLLITLSESVQKASSHLVAQCLSLGLTGYNLPIQCNNFLSIKVLHIKFVYHYVLKYP